MNDFPLVPLGSLFSSVTGGGTPPRQVTEYWNGSIPWASVKDFTEGSSRIDSTQESITESGLKASSSKLIKSGTPVICLRMAVGRSALTRCNLAINQDVKALYPEADVSPSYICFLLDFMRERVESRSIGSTVKGVSTNELLKIDVPFPSRYEQQQKIAKILTTVDNLIEKTQALIDKYTAIKQGMMADLFTRGVDLSGTPDANQNYSQLRQPYEQAPELYKQTELGWVPKEWEVIQLGQMASISSGITLGNEYDGSDSVEVPYLRVANVQDGYLDLADVKTIKIPSSNTERYRLISGDVLMNEGGDFDKLGRGAIWRGQIKDCAHQNHVFKVRANRELLIPEYLAYWSASIFGKQYFVKSSKQSTNLASINSTQLKQFPLLVPDLKEQNRIVNNISKADSFLLSLKEEIMKLKRVKSGLMQDLLTGKVRIN